MKKYLLWVLIIVPMLVNAQNAATKFQVKGQIIDSITAEPIPYVTCSVSPEAKPQMAITRFASDINGNFKGELKAPGTYVLVVTCVGKDPLKKRFSVNAGNTTVQFGKLAMTAGKQTLREVSVVAVKPLIKADAEKVTYDAEQDPEAKSSNVLELLRKVPMVTVDGQDNVQLKGQSNFKYFLNGKPTNMFNNNPGQILKSIPANMIKNIEVITQPGAKYDAEGVGGIINIVTIQQTSAKGYSATFNAQASSRGSYGGGVNLMIQQGKFSFSGNYSYNYNKQFPVTTTSDRYSSFSQYAHGRQVATVSNPTPMQFGTGQLSYEMDTMNLFTLSFNRRYGRPKSTTEAITENFDDADNQVFGYTQNSTQKQTWGSTDFGLDYQRSFHKKGETLTMSYKLSNSPNSSNYIATNEIDAKYTKLPPIGLLAQASTSNNIASTNEHTFQADYSNPIAKGHTLEFGGKYIIRLNDSKSNESYNYFDLKSTYPYPILSPVDSIFSYNNDQNILGTYASYTGNIKKWSLKTGLRYEYTWLKARFDSINKNFNTEYGVFVPSATLSYKITDMQSLKLGYNMRIQRPGIGYLNPYVDRKDPNYISHGNPNLDPEKNHNITLGYSSFAAKFNLSTELTYSFVNNAIQQYSFLNASSIQEITYDNIGHNKQLNLNLFGSYRGLPWLNLYTNSNIGYVKLNGTSAGMSNDGFTGRFYLGGTFMMPKDLKISTGGGGSLPQVNLQGSQSAFFFSYLALSKDMLKKRLNVSLSGVFLPKSHIIIDTNASTFTQRTDVHLTSNAELRFNVSYRIGEINAQVKKTKSTISNDDQKERENNSAGQSPM